MNKGSRGRFKCAIYHRAQVRAYREKHLEEVLARNRAYRKTHREELLARKRAYYAMHRDEILAKYKEKYDSDPLYRLGRFEKRRRARAEARLNKLGEVTSG